MSFCPKCGIDWDGSICKNCNYGAKVVIHKDALEEVKSQRKLRDEKNRETAEESNDSYETYEGYQTEPSMEFSSISDALNASVKMYFKSFPAFLIINLVTNLFCYIVFKLAMLVINPAFLDFTDNTTPDDMEAALSTVAVLGFSLVNGMASIWYYFLNHYQSASILYFADMKHSGHSLGMFDIRLVISSLLKGIFGAFSLIIPRCLAFLIVVIGSILFIIPGLYFQFKLVFVDSCCLFSDSSAIPGSWRLSKGNFWQIVLIYIGFKSVPVSIAMFLGIVSFVGFVIVMSKLVWFPLSIACVVSFTIFTMTWHFSTVAFYNLFRYLEENENQDS